MMSERSLAQAQKSSQSPWWRRWCASSCSCALLALLVLPAWAPAPLAAEEADDLSADQVIAELRAMVEDPRDTEIYELDFEPINFDRILVRDALGDNQVFHYVTFRLRNRVSDNAEYTIKHASVYNEVLDKMVREYGFLRKETEGGTSLVVDDIRELEDRRLATILEREELSARTRKVDLTVIAHNEHGTRFRLFDPVPGEGPQEDFNFPDRSLAVANNNFYQRVRESIEERYRQRLYTTHEIRELQIPPYDPDRPTTFEDGYGMAQGEIHGVIIFDRLSDYGNEFTIEFQGLSNKQRFNWPERLPQGRVEDYFNLRVARRIYVMHITRPGDEFNLDRKRFTVESAGWRWSERFLRLEQRKAIAYSRYFRHNIRLPEESSTQVTYDRGDGTEGTTTAPVLHDAGVANQFWTHYNDVRSAWPARYEAKMREHAEHSEQVVEPYHPPVDERQVTPAELERLAAERAAWDALLERHQQLLRERQENLPERLPDMRATLDERR